MTSPVKVLIVGAGPVGLVLACHLRLLGLAVRVIEKRPGPSQHSKAIGLQYRVSEVLARLGVVERFTAEGGNPTSVNIYAGHERLVRLQFVAPKAISGRNAFQPRAILIPQSRTEAILLDYLLELGGTVEWQTELESYTERSDRVIARVKRLLSTEDIESEWLVSCEGAHSVVRKQAGITFQGKTYGLAFLMADVRMKGLLSHSESHVWLHKDGSLAALPLPADDTWRLFVEMTPSASGSRESITVDDLRRLASMRAPGMDATIEGEPLWLSDFRINCRMVDRMHAGRVFLAGDAAHIHSPTGGQGITTGMQDAVNLAWKLARVESGAPVTLLDTYDEERLPHAAEVLRETDRTTNLLFAPNPLLRLLRNAVVLPVLRSAWAQRRMFGKLSQLHVHYRRSSLSKDSRGVWRRRRIRAGDRAPDVALGTAAGGVTTLFKLMSSMRPIVLFNGVRPPDLRARLDALHIDGYLLGEAAESRGPPLPPDLVDLDGDFASLYGLRKGFICLIRPDGHVGLIAEAGQEHLLRSYLERLCSAANVRKAFA